MSHAGLFPFSTRTNVTPGDSICLSTDRTMTASMKDSGGSTHSLSITPISEAGISIAGNGPGPPSDTNSVFEVAINDACATGNDSSSSACRQSCCTCNCPKKGPTETHRKVALGMLLMSLGSVFWVGTTQATKRTYQWPTFFAPFFVVYFTTAWLILCYPLCIAAIFIYTRGKMSLKETFRESMAVFGAEGLGHTHQKTAAKCIGFTILWTVIVYVFIRSLHLKSCLDATALFATNTNFVYLMSWIVLQKRFIAVRIVAFIVSMTGIIMVTYMGTGFASHDMWGSVLVMVTTAAAAAYKVLFKRIMGDVSYDQHAFFITCIGLSSLVTTWPILLVFYFTETEQVTWSAIPWGPLCTAAAFAFLMHLLLNFGAGFTYHQFINASLILSIPLCEVVDLLLSDITNRPVTGMQICAYVLIVFGFLLNSLPEDWHEKTLKALRWNQPRHARPEDAHLSPRQRLRSANTRTSAC